MRIIAFGLFAIIAFSALNGAMSHFSEGKASFLYWGIFGVIPIDWAIIGGWMGGAVGFGHRGVDEADGPFVSICGAVAAVVCVVLTHVIQFVSIVGGWDFDVFLRYLGLFGEMWDFGPAYMWVSTALAAVTGGFAALGTSHSQRADNIRTSMPDWVSPTSRILIFVARADGHVDNSEAALIAALIRAQMLKTLAKIPNNIEAALWSVIEAEVHAIQEGRKLEHELKQKCFRSPERRESVAKLAIAVAQADGSVSDQEVAILDKIMDAWNIGHDQRDGLATDAFNEFRMAL